MSTSSAMPQPTQGDDVQESASGSSTPDPNYRKKATGPQGELLELALSENADDQTEAVRRQVKMWDKQNPAMKRRKVFWDRNRLWLKGVRGVRARPASRDFSDWALYVPPGALDIPPLMDRAEELLDRVASHLLVDAPVPSVEPMTNADADRDGAEFASRLLVAEGDEAGTNDLLLFRRAVKRAGVFGSAFLYEYVDPQGGGWEPMDVDGHPDAPEGTPVEQAHLDPATGQPIEKGLVSRPVGTRDGQKVIVGSPKEADQRWKPKLCVKVLDGRTVRPLPETAKDVADAVGVMILDITTLGALKDRFPELKDASADEQQELVKWVPEAAKWALPWYVSSRFVNTVPTDDEGHPTDDAPVVTLATYFRSHGAYEKGAYLLSCGGTRLLHAQPWCAEVDGAEECLSLPVSQFRQITDDDNDDFYGKGLIEMIGPAGEVRGAIVIGMLDYLDRFLHPLQYLPIGSEVQPEAMAARDGTPIFVTPGMEAFTENVPPFPQDLKEFFDRATAAQNDTVGLFDNGQMIMRASQSGVAKQQDVAATNVNMTALRSNLADGIERYWRIGLELRRAFYTQSQLMSYLGPDGAYKERRWSGLDLKSAKRVRIQQGSFTQRTPEAKAALALQWSVPVGPGLPPLLSPAEAKQMIIGSIQPLLGLQDDPHLLRIRRQIDVYQHGPTPEFEQQMAQYQQAAQQAAQQAQAQPQDPTGQQPPQGPPPPTMFDRLPVDLLPTVAALRAHELGSFLAGTKFESLPDDWKQQALQEFDAMRQAAGLMTTQEQAQAAAAQQQAAEATKAQGQSQVAQVKSQGNAQVAQIKAQADAQQQSAEQEFELKKIEVAAALNPQVQAGAAPSLEGGVVQQELGAQHVGAP